jgi:hypothetical protein
MRIKKIIATVKINNLPDYDDAGFMVVRQDDGELWYYGTYETEERAKEVAIEIGNGAVIEVR